MRILPSNTATWAPSEVEGEAQDHVGGEVDLDPLARRRFGNDERLALLRERRDLAGGLDELEPERVARGLRSRMAALRGLYSMLGTNGGFFLISGVARASADNREIKEMLQGLGYEGHFSRARLRARKIRAIFVGFFCGKRPNSRFGWPII